MLSFEDGEEASIISSSNPEQLNVKERLEPERPAACDWNNS
jgi:hypothetical protein